MFTIHKILLTVAIILEANGSPLFEGISFQRGFEIKFKPLERKPIEFIKEKLTPFGVFGRKFAIHKRSLGEFSLKSPEHGGRPAAPVFEELEEIEHTGPQPVFLLPHHLKPPLPPVKAPVEPHKPPPPPPVPVVTSPKPPPPPLPVPLPIIVNEELPPKPPVVPPISTNMVIIQPTTLVKNHEHLKPGLYTHITEHVKPPPPVVEPKPPVLPESVPPPPVPPPPVTSIVRPIVEPPIPPGPIVPLIVPPSPKPVEPVPPPPPNVPVPPIQPKAPVPVPLPPPVLEKEAVKEEPLPPLAPEPPKFEISLKDSSLIKGSKMALQFGTVFLTLMAQFFDNARATIDLMTNPPPKFKE